MVPTITTKGFRCSLDEAAYSPSREGYLHILSLVGSREAVWAILSKLMTGHSAHIQNGNEYRTVRVDTQETGKVLTERLPSGSFHGLYLSRALQDGWVLVGATDHELPGRFYGLLNTHLRLPLHVAWKDWLWEHAQTAGMVEKLSSTWVAAYAVNRSIFELEGAVRVALVNGELPQIEVKNAA